MKRATNDSDGFAKWIIAWVLCTLGAVFMAFVIAWLNPAAAGQMTPSECYAVAIDVYNIARWRDGGMPEIKASKIIHDNALAMIGEPDSYLATKEDVDMLIGLVHQVFSSTQPAEELAIRSYNACIRLGYGNNFKRT